MTKFFKESRHDFAKN